jgi:hypothetical protein
MAADIGQIVFPESLNAVQDVLVQGLRTAALIAIATMIIIQVIKVPIRFAFHFWMTRHWLARRESKAKLFDNAKNEVRDWLMELDSTRARIFKSIRDDPLPPLVGLMPFVPMDLYLKKIQNIAQRALEHPAQHGETFAYFAADAALPDMVVVYQVDAIAEKNPKFLERLTVRDPSEKSIFSSTFDESAAAAVASAQDNVSTSIERSLDDLQIRLMFWWPILMRFAVIIAALVLYLSIVHGVAKEPLTAKDVLNSTIIGVAAGYLASFAYDLLSLLAAFRPRSQ